MKDEKKQLIIKISESAHDRFRERELSSFYGRLKIALDVGNSVEVALEKACLKGEKRRNDVQLYADNFMQTVLSNKLSTYDGFKQLIFEEIINVQKFETINFEEDQEERKDKNFSRENVLKNFNKLSAGYKREIFKVALITVDLVESYTSKGIVPELLRSHEMKPMIVKQIHEQWMKKKVDEGQADYVFLEYYEHEKQIKRLGEDIFDALLYELENSSNSLIEAESDQLCMFDFAQSEHELPIETE